MPNLLLWLLYRFLGYGKPRTEDVVPASLTIYECQPRKRKRTA